jgi:hypothetical protein
MAAPGNTDRIREWFNQQVDPAFQPLLERFAQSRVATQWEKDDCTRTLRIQLGDREITFRITVYVSSDPRAGEILFQAPDTEERRTFSPVLPDSSRTPEEMTGADLVNYLVDQYARWRTSHGLSRSHT